MLGIQIDKSELRSCGQRYKFDLSLIMSIIVYGGNVRIIYIYLQFDKMRKCNLTDVINAQQYVLFSRYQWNKYGAIKIILTLIYIFKMVEVNRVSQEDKNKIPQICSTSSSMFNVSKLAKFMFTFCILLVVFWFTLILYSLNKGEPKADEALLKQ